MHYDVIVLGLGAMGLAAAWRLASRGLRVLGLDQYTLPHTLGSSHGHTRIIRQAYYEHPDYVPLLRHAYAGWHEMEQLTGQHLFTQCPCLSLGPPEGELIQGVIRASREHALPLETLSPDEVLARFPAFSHLDSFAAVVEPTAGVLAVEESLRAMARLASGHSAILRERVAMRDWRREGDGVAVVTDEGTVHAARLVITAGPWAARVLATQAPPLRVMRQVVFWFSAAELARFRRDRFPVFIADTPGGYFYGMPAFDSRGVKVAQHYGAPEMDDPDAIERTITAADEQPVRDFLRRYLPEADAPVSEASTCIYTLTPDRHFWIDSLDEAVVVAAGFSGHGFKFAPVVGEILADRAMHGRTALPAQLFQRRAFAPLS
jgi:sarcosine oxidase